MNLDTSLSCTFSSFWKCCNGIFQQDFNSQCKSELQYRRRAGPCCSCPSSRLPPAPAICWMNECWLNWGNQQHTLTHARFSIYKYLHQDLILALISPTVKGTSKVRNVIHRVAPDVASAVGLLSSFIWNTDFKWLKQDVLWWTDGENKLKTKS